MIGINFCGDFLSKRWDEVAVRPCRGAPRPMNDIERFHREFRPAGELIETFRRHESFLAAWRRAVRTTGVDTTTVADHIDYIVGWSATTLSGWGRL